MTQLFVTILPQYANIPFQVINLAEEYTTSQKQMKNIQNQLEFLEATRLKYSTQCILGGFLEDRSLLWSGFEESKKMIHLGIDINNLQVGSSVTLPCSATVVHVFKDTSKLNGWGGRLIFKLSQPYLGADYLLYGHLDPERLPANGTRFNLGDIVGYLGDVTVNGGWFIHLHVQLIKEAMFKSYENLDKLDGYLLDSDTFIVEEITVDPTFLVCK